MIVPYLMPINMMLIKIIMPIIFISSIFMGNGYPLICTVVTCFVPMTIKNKKPLIMVLIIVKILMVMKNISY